MCSKAVLVSHKTGPNPPSPAPVLEPAAVRSQLERILASELFQHSRRYPSLLRHIVERTLDGAGDALKERTLGVAVFKCNPKYDTSADPVVRTTASEIRKRLQEYYSDPAHKDEPRIVLPVGAYVPEFHSAVELDVQSAAPRKLRAGGSCAPGSLRRCSSY